MTRGSRIAYAVLVALLCASAAIAVVAVVGGVVLAVRPDTPSRVASSASAPVSPSPQSSASAGAGGRGTATGSSGTPSPSRPGVGGAPELARAQELARKALGGRHAEITSMADDSGAAVVVTVEGADDGLQEALRAAVAGTGVTVVVREPHLSAAKLAAAEKRLRAAFAQPPLNQYALVIQRDPAYGRLVVIFPSRLPGSLFTKVQHLIAPYGPGVGIVEGR